MFGIVGFVILLIALGSQDSETKPLTKRAALASDRDLLTAYCKVIPDEDSDNGGIRADGKPWDLTDLAVDAPNQYNLFVLQSKSDLPHMGAALDDDFGAGPRTKLYPRCARVSDRTFPRRIKAYEEPRAKPPMHLRIQLGWPKIIEKRVHKNALTWLTACANHGNPPNGTFTPARPEAKNSIVPMSEGLCRCQYRCQFAIENG
jgi:hypothetical protein